MCSLIVFNSFWNSSLIVFNSFWIRLGVVSVSYCRVFLLDMNYKFNFFVIFEMFGGLLDNRLLVSLEGFLIKWK